MSNRGSLTLLIAAFLLVTGCTQDSDDPSAPEQAGRIESSTDLVRYEVSTVEDYFGSRIDGPEPSPAASTAAELVDFNDRDFAGSYVDDDGVVHVVAVTERGSRLAEKKLGGESSVVIENGTWSHAAANELGAELMSDSTPALEAKLAMSGFDVESGSLRVVLNEMPTAADREVIELFAEEHELPIGAYIIEEMGTFEGE